MKTKKTSSFYITLALILCAVYIIFAIKPLGFEYQLTPGWKIDVTNPTISEPEENERLLHFKLGQSIGYFTEDGKVTNFISYPYKSSISKEYYTFYSANSSAASFYLPSGKKSGTINISGFPMIQYDRIYVFLPGGSSFVQCSEDGTKAWEYSGTVPITAFDSSEYGCIAGFADGSVCEFASDGTIIQRFSPGGSEFPVILGAAISSDASLVAVVCGQNKQRFVLAKNDGVNAKIIFHEFLDSSDPYQKLVRFYNNDGTVIYNSGNLLGFVETKTGQSAHLEIKGQALNVQESGDCIFILAKDGGTYTVYMVEKLATLIGMFSFEAKTAFIQTDGNKLYVGKDSTISQLVLSKK